MFFISSSKCIVICATAPEEMYDVHLIKILKQKVNFYQV